MALTNYGKRQTDFTLIKTADNDLTVLGSGAKDIRRDAQGLVNIVEGLRERQLADNEETRDQIQSHLDAISITIKSLQRHFAKR